MIALSETMALTGMPEAMPLATVMMSGSIPKCSKPHILPVRPMPVWISSTISMMPYLSQRARTFLNQRSVGTMYPPSPAIVSTITPATSSGITMVSNRYSSSLK